MEISVMMVESVINKGKMIVLWALTSLAFCNKIHWFEKKSKSLLDTPAAHG